MQLSYIKKIAPLLTIASCYRSAIADDIDLMVAPGNECVDLVTGSDFIPLGEACTEVTGDNVVVAFNMTGEGIEEAGCCIKETHICNMPPTIASQEEEGCLKTKVVPIDIGDVYGFACWELFDSFQINGHATVICDRPLRGDIDEDVEPGDPLPDGDVQGSYGEHEYHYGAMYDVGLGCGPTATSTCNADPTSCDVTASLPDLPSARRTLIGDLMTDDSSGKNNDNDPSYFPDEFLHHERERKLLRLPFGPGTVKLVGCTAAHLRNIGVLPESGASITIPPVNNVEYPSDGIIIKGMCPNWFKVGDHCDSIITCTPLGGLSADSECNACASWIEGFPSWQTAGVPVTCPVGW